MPDLTTLQWILLMTIANGFIAFAGAFSFFISKRNLEKIILPLVSFATGALLGGALFHFIPESLEKLQVTKTLSIIIFGFISFYLIEKILHWHHCHGKRGVCKHQFTYLILYGDSIHNFIDGLIIAGAFITSTPLGIITSLLILIHELPQEIGDFGVLVYGGLSKTRALIYNFLAQLTAVLGGILGFFFLSIDQAFFLLPFAAGGFIYIAVMDLIPEIFKEKSKEKLILNILAIILGLLILISSKIIVG